MVSPTSRHRPLAASLAAVLLVAAGVVPSGTPADTTPAPPSAPAAPAAPSAPAAPPAPTASSAASPPAVPATSKADTTHGDDEAAVADMPPLPDALWRGNEKARGVLAPDTDFSRAMPFERRQGGAGTSLARRDANAFSHETSTLGFDELQRFKLGNALFNKFWVSAPSSTLASDGVGPFFSARACQSCHVKDGRGQLPVGEERTASFLLQLARERSDGTWGGDPSYGVQLQASAVPGVPAEGRVRIETTPLVRRFADGTEVTLRAPTYHVDDLAYGELDPATVFSPRLAPAMIGLGLLEAIDEDAILARADAADANGDGISGRPNVQPLPNGGSALGRFGHKAGKATLRQQNAHALHDDMGLSTSLKPDPDGDCTLEQSVCEALADGVQARLGEHEVSDELLDLVTFYSANLAVPARADVENPDVLAGKALFAEAGCVGCHVPRHVTSADAEQPEHRFQLIWPYTDLLLHDMGDELADGAVDKLASGSEWRTAPLWGIGASRTVNPRTSFLHDGRAATPMEAVLWHGGEALGAREAVLAYDADERAALERFLDSL